jgi:hippurate hydrolase
VRKQTLDAIRRIARGQALAAGMPEDRLPEVKISADFTPAMYNDPALMERVVKTLKAWMGESKLVAKKPSMGGEDFAEYGRVEPRVPICMLSVGGVAADAFQESQRSGRPLPSLHSPLWAPLPEPTIKTGITVLTASVFELMK